MTYMRLFLPLLGFTYILERCIGTDPCNADTDVDGLIDGGDRNPLAAPRGRVMKKRSYKQLSKPGFSLTGFIMCCQSSNCLRG